MASELGQRGTTYRILMPLLSPAETLVSLSMHDNLIMWTKDGDWMPAKPVEIVTRSTMLLTGCYAQSHLCL